MLDHDPLMGNRLVLGFLLRRQLSTSGFLVRGDELWMILAVIAFVPYPGFIRKPLLQRRPSHGRLKAVDDDFVHGIWRPGGLVAPPLLLGVPFLGREEIPQDRHHFMAGVLRGVGTASP